MANIPLGVNILLDAFSPFPPEDIIWDEYAGDKTGTPRYDHAIEERGFIEFKYPTVPGMVTTNTVRKLPFFENPRINESRGASYAETSIFMRNEPVRLFTGAGATKFDIELMYTLPHIGAFYNNYYMRVCTDQQRQEIEDTVTRYKEILNRDEATKGNKQKYPGATGFVSVGNKVVGYKAGTAITDAQFTDDAETATEADHAAGKTFNYETAGPRMPVKQPVRLGEKNELDGKGFFRANALDSDYHSMIAGLVDYFMNIIRSSIISTVDAGVSEKVKYGPPIAYLKFGTAYDYIPCIVKSYKIEIDPFRAGMDNATFYSRMIRVKLALEEFRQEGGIVDAGQKGPFGWNTIFNSGGIPRGNV